SGASVGAISGATGTASGTSGTARVGSTGSVSATAFATVSQDVPAFTSAIPVATASRRSPGKYTGIADRIAIPHTPTRPPKIDTRPRQANALATSGGPNTRIVADKLMTHAGAWRWRPSPSIAAYARAAGTMPSTRIANGPRFFTGCGAPVA